MDYLGRIIKCGHKRYRAVQKIGSWGDNLEYPVYLCVRHPQRLAHIKPVVIIKVQRRISNDNSWGNVNVEINRFFDCFLRYYQSPTLMIHYRVYVHPPSAKHTFTIRKSHSPDNYASEWFFFNVRHSIYLIRS